MARFLTYGCAWVITMNSRTAVEPTPPMNSFAAPAEIHFTLYNNLKATDSPTNTVKTWEEVVAFMSNHTRTYAKDAAGGFGPYLLQEPFAPCYRHKDGLPRAHAHRCDECVRAITLAVFDADLGNQADIDACRARLTQAGVSHFWYSSFSYNQAVKEGGAVLPFRLLIPLSRQVDPAQWTPLRRTLIQQFQIPADEKKCGGKSHFYYLPSCPLWGEPATYFQAGGVYVVPDVAAKNENALDVVALRGALRLPDFEAPEEVADLDERASRISKWRKALEKRQANLSKKRGDEKKATWLYRCLTGAALDGHGSRNDATCSVAGMLVFATDGKATVGELVEIMRPSVEAMMKEGSTVTWEDVERLLLTSMRNRFQAEQRDTALVDALMRRMKVLKRRDSSAGVSHV